MNKVGILEGLLYVQGDEGLTLEQASDILELNEEETKELILELKNKYEDESHGLRINYLGNTFKLTTKEEHKEYYKKLILNEENSFLSNPALETLAIIAYNEPLTRLKIEEIRGVESSYIIRKLLAKGFIKECGKETTPGRPTLYKTTDDFLDYFGLATKDDLPQIDFTTENITNTDEDLFQTRYVEGEYHEHSGDN